MREHICLETAVLPTKDDDVLNNKRTVCCINISLMVEGPKSEARMDTVTRELTRESS